MQQFVTVLASITLLDHVYDLFSFLFFKLTNSRGAVKVHPSSLWRKVLCKIFRITISDDGIYLPKLSERITNYNK